MNTHFQKYFLTLLISLFAWPSIKAVNTCAENIFYSLQQISIVGHTNVNSFWLKYSGIEPLQKITDIADIPHLKAKSITINILARNFVCSNHLMKNDFLSLIHADESPYINIQLQGFQGLANLKNDSTEVMLVNITLAGVKRTMEVYCNITKDSANYFTMTGSRLVKLSDFNLVAPSKFLGLVKVKNEITINFEIKLMVQGS